MSIEYLEMCYKGLKLFCEFFRISLEQWLEFNYWLDGPVYLFCLIFFLCLCHILLKTAKQFYFSKACRLFYASLSLFMLPAPLWNSLVPSLFLAGSCTSGVEASSGASWTPSC